MNVNQQLMPMRLLTVSALLRHLPEEHPKFPVVESDFCKRHAGWRGEKISAITLMHFLINSTVFTTFA
ncbi:hypothetical protein NBRC111894_3693 [Sporolactobacillus inulinus]|uniref:Uncharacterized protein n=1 Tax=Sporolactobacillus inulinus TaxID=2078 RepID=A0A4Y1ZGI9_9BACL|nr:hypothetical protein [Sporolactobacillus inulinus]GAY78139.1 hypothetical protein NBRC111894_3693 [Sporolactobacillus inulinus]